MHREAIEIGTMIDARYLVDYASDAAFAIDDDLTIVAWNYGARRLLGYVRREVLGRHCSEVLQVFSPNGEPLCVPDCEGARCFRHLRAFSALSCRARHKDGGWVPVDISEADKLVDKQAAEAGIYFGFHTDNRVTLSMGRDLVLEPAQEGAPLNYIVHPYAEVDGEPHRVAKQGFWKDAK